MTWKRANHASHFPQLPIKENSNVYFLNLLSEEALKGSRVQVKSARWSQTFHSIGQFMS